MSAKLRTVTTDEQVALSDRRFFVRRHAEREARRLNAGRVALRPYGPTYEWRVIGDGRRWRLAAFQNRLVSDE